MENEDETKKQLLQELASLRQQVEEHRANEKKYRDFVENVQDGCTEIDMEGRVVFSNKFFQDISGYSPAEIARMKRWEWYPTPEEYQRVLQSYVEILDTGNPALIQYKLKCKMGDIKDVEILASPARDEEGHPTGFWGVGRDVTDRKRMEAENEKYRSFVENVNEFCFELDLNGNYTFGNNAILKKFNISREGLSYRTLKSFVPADDYQKIVSTFKDMCQTGKDLKMIVHKVLLPNGETGYCELSASLIRDEAGHPIGFRGVSRDVTDRDRLTRQFHHAQRMEALGTLAGGMAHDFNNLLTGIQGYTSLMIWQTDPAHPHYSKLKAIEAFVQSGANLTRQMLGYARGNRGEAEPTDLNDVMSTTAKMFGRTRKEISLHEQYDKALWSVAVDRGQFEQVLLNLFVNAWQAMPDGGALHLETQNVILDESYTKMISAAPGPYVKLSVTDTGMGMDEETRLRIFDPFFTTKGQEQGTGLGLASVYSIMKGHQGFIDVYSEVGNGTTFNLYLPASQEEVVKNPSKQIEVLGGHETILLVDDEVMIADVTGQMLMSMGYQVLIAHSGAEALAIYLVKQERIDLVIIDMIMPVEGGGETFDRIKAVNPAVRVILASGYPLTGKGREMMSKGVKEFLQKPFRLDVLSLSVRMVLDG